MKVTLRQDVPVGLEHGMTSGRVFSGNDVRVTPGRRTLGLEPKRGENDDRVEVLGDAGQWVLLHRAEYFLDLE